MDLLELLKYFHFFKWKIHIIFLKTIGAKGNLGDI